MMDSGGRTRKTGETVAAGIRRRIACGELQIGERLPTEEELTEHFGIARTTLREALRILEFQGLIAIKRGRGGGATVTTPDLDRLAEPLAVVLQLRRTTAGDLDEARRLIEPQLASWLAKNHTDDDLEALQTVARAARLAADDDDADRFGQAAAEMHLTIIERGGNNTLSVISQLLHAVMLDRYTTASQSSGQILLQRAAKSYQKLVDLIGEGQAEHASAHWEQQLLWVTALTSDQLLDVYDDRPTQRG